MPEQHDTQLAPEVGVTFEDCVKACLSNEDLVAEFDRLFSTNLSTVEARTPIEIMVDKATGHDEKRRLEVKKFVAFVYEAVWIRLDPRTRAPQQVEPPGQ
jgi:hypothetical protein